jgi:hypothetical protein
MPERPPQPVREYDGRRLAKVHQKQMDEREQRMERFLAAYVSCDYRVGAACEAAGIAKSTYLNWKSQFPDFLTRLRDLDAARLKLNPNLVAAVVRGDLSKFHEWRWRYMRVRNDDGHNRIADAISRAQAGKITLILAPPEAGKTTTLEDYIAFRIAMDPNIRITYVHQSDDFAKDVVGRVQTILTDEGLYKDLISTFGPFKGGKGSGEWSSHALTVAKKDSTERGNTLKGRSIYSRAQGIRADLLLIDDIQDITTIGQTARILKVLRQTFFTRAVRQAPICMVGNRVDVGDVWEQIMEDPALAEMLDIVIIPAIEDGKSLFPSVREVEEWDTTRRLVGDDVWFRNYMQRPRMAGEGTFRPDDIYACVSTEYTAGTTEGWHGRGVITGVDPALGGGCAVVTCVWGDDFIAPIDVTWRKGLKRNEQIYAIVAEHAARYSPSHLVFEIATLQRGLARDERFEEMAREFGFRIIEHETSGKKVDPTLGVGAMASSFIRREVILPADVNRPTEPSELLYHLYDQLLVWRPDIPTRLLTQDALMAFWFCWRWWRENRRYDKGGDDAWGGKAMPAAAPRFTVPRLTSGVR